MPAGDEEKRVRTMFLTYQAEDSDADTFMIVVGSIAENFRGVQLVEFQDDTVFADGADPMETLHELVTSAGRLTPEQRGELAQFSARLNEWQGDES